MIDDWRLICTRFGFDDDFVYRVYQDYHDDAYQSCYYVFRTWRDTSDMSYDDKVDHLCLTLRGCGYDDCANKVQWKYRTEHGYALCDHLIYIYGRTLADDWQDFCRALRCDDDFIFKIKQDCGDDNYMCISTALKYWRNTVDCSYADMVDLFCHACEARGFHDIAVDCRAYFRQESYGRSFCCGYKGVEGNM